MNADERERLACRCLARADDCRDALIETPRRTWLAEEEADFRTIAAILRTPVEPAVVGEGAVSAGFVRVIRTLLNVEAMPNRDPSVKNGLRSVTEGKVTWGTPTAGGMGTVICVRHGAMLRVGEKLWRCPTCNEGAYTPDGITHDHAATPSENALPEQPQDYADPRSDK